MRQLPEWGSEARRRCDPVADGWPSEAWAERIERDLPEPVLALLRGDAAGFEALLSERYAGSSELWPAKLEGVFDDGDLSVARAASIDAKLRPRAELRELARVWGASWSGASALRVDVDVDGLELRGDDAFETRIRLRVSGTIHAQGAAGDGARQQNIRWVGRWESPAPADSNAAGSAGAPRLASLVLERAEEVRVRTRPLADLTRKVLSGCDGFEQEILRGSDDYHLHQDRLSAQPFLGMHGLAVGDVDGDGLEDVYLPQPGGQPNRLLLHRPDGTAVDGSREAGLDVLDNSGPALILDLDNDGDQDVAIAVGSNLLFCWNAGSGRMSDYTIAPGPDAPEITSLSAADPDGDGDLDLFATRYVSGAVGSGSPTPYWNAENGARDLYWRNDGERKFVEASAEVGLDAHTTRFGLALLWEDLDDDGDVDLYVVNDFGKNSCFRNDGGKFTEVGEANGMAIPAAGMGVSCADADRDGDLDLFLTNMDSPAGARIASSPKFLPDQPEARAAYVGHAMGNRLLVNDGGGKFHDATETAGVGPGGWAWGGVFFELQNDGWPDLFVPNGYATGTDAYDLRGYFWRFVVGRSPREPPPSQAYVDAFDAIHHFTVHEGASWNGHERDFAYANLGQLRFAETSCAFGVDFQDDGRIAAPMDWDDDGRVDLWLRNRTGPRVRFLHNVHPAAGRWIALDLVGTKCNRDAIGARVVVEAGGVRTPQTVYAAQGFMGAPSRRLHFGLGASERVDRIEVRWPGGERETFESVAADARYRVVQGKGALERVAPRTHPALAAAAAETNVRNPRGVERIVLYERLPAAPIEVPAFAAAASRTKRRIADFRGAPLLVWTGPCADPASQHVLRGLAAKQRALAELGTPFVALESGDPSAEPAARATLRELGLEERAGRADKRFQRALEVLLVEVLGPFERLPYPLVLLFDGAGQLTAVYAGVPDLERVVADVAATRALNPAETSTAPLLGGRWALPIARNLRGVAGIFDLLGDAELAQYYRGLARSAR